MLQCEDKGKNKQNIVYVNDITYILNVFDFILFADDTIILYLHKNISSK